MQPTEATQELILKLADDNLIIGHRNSEWTGLGPVLEEDIAFSSIAQDKVGQAFHLYNLLHQSGAADPDQLAFQRKEADFKCCHFVEFPIGPYEFSLMRHFLFDHAVYLRWEMLSGSSFEPLAQLARKYRPEVKYHVFHGNTWIKQLATANEEARLRLQTALNEAWPLAFSIFEPGKPEAELKTEGIFEGEAALESRWEDAVKPLLEEWGLKIPQVDDKAAHYGGRHGYHTEHLPLLLAEMTEVFNSDPSAQW